MDLFFDLLPTTRKIRTHYHSFLLSLYGSVWNETERTRRALDESEAQAHAALAASGSVSQSAYPWSRREEARARALSKGWTSIFAGGLALDDPKLKSVKLFNLR